MKTVFTRNEVSAISTMINSVVTIATKHFEISQAELVKYDAAFQDIEKHFSIADAESRPVIVDCGELSSWLSIEVTSETVTFDMSEDAWIAYIQLVSEVVSIADEFIGENPVKTKMFVYGAKLILDNAKVEVFNLLETFKDTVNAFNQAIEKPVSKFIEKIIK